LKLAQNTCRSYSRGPAPVHQVQATFESVPADATRIASLRGFVLLPVYQSPEVVWFDVRPEAGEQTRESGPLKLKCSRMNRLRGCWSVALTLEPKDFPGAPEAKELALEDAQGAPFGMSSGSWGGGMVTAQFGAVADRVPVRLRVTTYPDCRFRRVAFELKDIALR
jgi:hypothetical protein